MDYRDNPAFKAGDLTAANAARNSQESGFIRRRRVLNGIVEILRGAGVQGVEIVKSQIVVPGWNTNTAADADRAIKRVGLARLIDDADRGGRKPIAVFGVHRGAKDAREAFVVIPVEEYARLVASAQTKQEDMA